MGDTPAEFAKKDSDYFALIGRSAMHGEWVGQVIEYRPASGPRYIFRLQYESGPRRGEEVELQRHEFYVLPTRDQIEQAVREAFENSEVTGIVTDARGPDVPVMETVIGDVTGWVRALLIGSAG